MSNGIVWFGLPADDTARGERFYSQLFGWKFEPFDGPFEYHVASEAHAANYPSHGEKGPVVYFGVEDVELATERVRKLGGSAEKVAMKHMLSRLAGRSRTASKTCSSARTKGALP